MDTALHSDTDEARKLPWKTIGGIAAVLAVLTVSAGVFSYVYTERPDVIKQVKLKLSTLGIASSDPAETKRVAEINKLTIPYEEKQILINKTIFLGATPSMVMLALGAAKEDHRVNDAKTGKEAIVWVYHLPQDTKPTMLKFDGGKLTHAYKGSAIEFDTIPTRYTGTNSE